MFISTRNNNCREPFSISGLGKQVRDVLHAKDLIGLYFAALDNIAIARGEAFNIGGGVENSLSLLELFSILESKLNIRLSYNKLPPRESDQKIFIADITKAKEMLGWTPKVIPVDGIDDMLRWSEENPGPTSCS